jgi:hypothetical protein
MNIETKDFPAVIEARKVAEKQLEFYKETMEIKQGDKNGKTNN